MIEYQIITFRCTACDYAFSGAEPTEQELAKHFVAEALVDFECPNCRTVTLERVTDDTKKSVVTVLEPAEVVEKNKDLPADEQLDVPTDKEIADLREVLECKIGV